MSKKTETEKRRSIVTLGYLKRVFFRSLYKQYITKDDKQVLLDQYEILEHLVELSLQDKKISEYIKE